MFTGIVETMGTVVSSIQNGTNKTFVINSTFSQELQIDQSVSHNGVCLTVEAINGNTHTVTAIAETLLKTNLDDWQPGDRINLERCMIMNGRIDGHIVQGHVDDRATCIAIVSKEGSYEYSFSFSEKFAALMIEKGSVCINGTSLTAFNVGLTTFTVAIIPYTFEHTNIQFIKAGDSVNIEFDIIGKYLARQREVTI